MFSADLHHSTDLTNITLLFDYRCERGTRRKDTQPSLK